MKTNAQKPDKKWLKKLFKGLVAASISQRVQVLSEVLQWYDAAITYVVITKKSTPNRHKELVRGTTFREQGIDTRFTRNAEDRERWFRAAIRSYERFCERLRPPRVDKFYALLQVKKKKLVAKDSRLAEKHGWVIRLLENSFAGSGIKIKVIDRAQKARHYNGEGEFIYSTEHADKMRKTFRKEGLLTVIVQEIPFITRAMAMYSIPGGFAYNEKKQVNAYEKMLISFLKFCRTADAPRRLVKREEGESKTSVSGKKKSRKVPEGRYTKNSCIDFLFRRLSNEKPWELKELFKGAPSAPEQPLKRLIKHGATDGEWEIKTADDVVQLVKTK